MFSIKQTRPENWFMMLQVQIGNPGCLQPISGMVKKMKIRLQIIALLLASGFVLMTSSVAWAQDPLSQPSGCPTSTTFTPLCATTYMYNSLRLGLNVNEGTLTRTAINAVHGLQIGFTEPVDDAIYAQPLYLPQVVTSGGTYNLVYVATENNTVYAFDADAGGTAKWQRSLTPTGSSPVNEKNDLNACNNINPMIPPYSGNVGITGTPVIDISANISPTTVTKGTLYAVAASKSPSGCTSGCTFVQKLFALDVTSGGILDSIDISP